MFDLDQELDQVRSVLDDQQIEYALCGGLAMAVHGAPRATVDIDLLVNGDDVERIETVAAPLGFKIKAHPMSFSGGAVKIRRVSKIDPDDGEVLMLDLLLVTPEVASAWSSREIRSWRGRPLGVVSKEGLVTLKTFRLSDQDRADIARLQEDI
ncbi:MAG: nucleotidyl transferase AbiEii/AbiGii toxin family protein [Thermoanaerobaculia bacterium]